jgi:hypothetical protein
MIAFFQADPIALPRQINLRPAQDSGTSDFGTQPRNHELARSIVSASEPWPCFGVPSWGSDRSGLLMVE